MEPEETSGGDRNVLYFVFEGSNMQYTFIKTHQTLKLQLVHFIICKLYLKVQFKNPK